MPKKKKVEKETKRFPGSADDDQTPDQELEALDNETPHDGLPSHPKKDIYAGKEDQLATRKDTEGDDEDEDEELNEEIDRNFEMAWNAEREWIDEAKEDIEFKSGKQWADDDADFLRQQRRPCLTLNKIKAIIRLLTGHWIQNSPRITVAPEGGEDQKFSGVADRLLNHFDKRSKLEFNLGYLFSGGETTGRGHIELYIDYEKDPIFGQLKTIYHGKPGMILMDPRGSSYDLNEDREFGFKMIKKSKAELKALYPKMAEKIDDEIGLDNEDPNNIIKHEGDANNYGLNAHSTTVGLNASSGPALIDEKSYQYHGKEYWRWVRATKFFAYFVKDGSTQEFESMEAAEEEAEKRKQEYLSDGGLPDQWEVVIRERQKKEMWVTIRVGGVILENGISPLEPSYSGYPFFQFLADWTPEAEEVKEQIQGIVRSLKDPQREKNKSRSQFLHIINTAANAGWIIDKDAMDPDKIDELKKFGSTPGIIIQKKPASTVQRIEPTPAPVAQQIREKASNDDFKEISGFNSDLLALDESANPSGKAMALRIRQGLTILEPDFRNFRYTKSLIGNAIMQMVPTLTDVSKIEKILGKTYMETNGIDTAYIKAFLIQIEDLKYNVEIAEQGDTKTNREETFEDLMQMMAKGQPIPFEVLSEFMQIPNKTELVNKVKEYEQAVLAAQAGGAKPGQPPPQGPTAVQ